MNLKFNAYKMYELGKTVYRPYEETEHGILRMHNPYEYWKDRLANKWVFSIVRNPYARAVSMWQEFSHRPEFIKKYGVLDLYEFYTKLPERFEPDGKWGVRTTQYDFLKNEQGKIELDIFKNETELPLLESKLGFKFTNTNYNSSPTYNINEFLTKDVQDLIEKIFEVDFVQFNYTVHT